MSFDAVACEVLSVHSAGRHLVVGADDYEPRFNCPPKQPLIAAYLKCDHTSCNSWNDTTTHLQCNTDHVM